MCKWRYTYPCILSCSLSKYQYHPQVVCKGPRRENVAFRQHEVHSLTYNKSNNNVNNLHTLLHEIISFKLGLYFAGLRHTDEWFCRQWARHCVQVPDEAWTVRVCRSGEARTRCCTRTVDTARHQLAVVWESEDSDDDWNRNWVFTFLFSVYNELFLFLTFNFNFSCNNSLTLILTLYC